MSLETKGTIKYDPDVKAGDAEYVVECKPLGATDILTLDGVNEQARGVKFLLESGGGK